MVIAYCKFRAVPFFVRAPYKPELFFLYTDFYFRGFPIDVSGEHTVGVINVFKGDAHG